MCSARTGRSRTCGASSTRTRPGSFVDLERYGAGHGITRIAKALNADRIAPPRTRKLGWAPTAVREILYRDLYRGVIVWDKLQKIVKRGTKTRRVRPESEWTRVDAPELRIVDDALWDRVRERLDANQASYARVAGGKLRARPARVDLDSKYLLSGFLVCAECGHTVTAAPRTVKGGAVQSFYRCTINWKRGHTVCGHNSIVSIDPLHEETFAALAGVLDERVVSRAFERALDKFKADHSTVGDRRAVLDREIEAAQGRERNLARAVALLPPDGLPDAILTELKAEQARRQGLERERAELDGAERFAATSREALKAEVSEALSDLSALLTASVPQARQALRWLGARFALKPVMLPDGRRGVEFSGGGIVCQALLAGVRPGGRPWEVQQRASCSVGGVPDGIRHPLQRPADPRRGVPASSVAGPGDRIPCPEL